MHIKIKKIFSTNISELNWEVKIKKVCLKETIIFTMTILCTNNLDMIYNSLIVLKYHNIFLN